MAQCTCISLHILVHNIYLLIRVCLTLVGSGNLPTSTTVELTTSHPLQPVPQISNISIIICSLLHLSSNTFYHLQNFLGRTLSNEGCDVHSLSQIYGQMKSTVEQLSWVERLYPSRLGERMAGGLDSLSDWLKSSRSSQTSAPDRKQPQQQQQGRSSSRCSLTTYICMRSISRASFTLTQCV